MAAFAENKARILRGVAGVYLISNPQIGLQDQAVPRGLFRKSQIKPLPGDIVKFSDSGDPDIPYVIESIQARKNVLIRPPISNIDLLLLTASLELPEVDYHFLDRMLAYAYKNEIDAAFVLTKADLPESEKNKERFLANYSRSQIPIFIMNPIAEIDDLNQLKLLCKDKLAAFCGQSGVGKSTLMNRILGREVLETGVLSQKAGRGKQTTRSTEIYQTQDGYLADTPGFQSLDLERLGLEAKDLLLAFPELMKIEDQCRFSDCHHLGEAGCAADQADISPERLERYRDCRKRLDEIEKNPRF